MDSQEGPSDRELVALADWAEEMYNVTPYSAWKRAYGELRAGADRLLRRRALTSVSRDPSVAPFGFDTRPADPRQDQTK